MAKLGTARLNFKNTFLLDSREENVSDNNAQHFFQDKGCPMMWISSDPVWATLSFWDIVNLYQLSTDLVTWKLPHKNEQMPPACLNMEDI